MESQRFDNLSRMMAGGASRRTVLRGAFGGALAAIGLRAGAAAKADKVDICHYDADTGTYHWINVSQNALEAHLNHGDFTECDGNFEVDFDSCTCVCGLTSCEAGYDLDLNTCSCVPDPTYCSSSGASCNNGAGLCATDVDTDSLVCITYEGDCNYPCTTAEGTCSDGWVCVNDGFCGQSHCHPLA